MKSVVLIVLDGWGIAPDGRGNCIYLAHPQNYLSLLNSYPNTQLYASGQPAGLPQGEVGNSEVGHINLGAGRIVYQSLPRINLSIADGSFFNKEKLLEGISHLKKTGGDLHLIGLVGSGSVHASIDHLYALLFLCQERVVRNVFLHLITDGRDSPPQSAKIYLNQVQEKLNQIGFGKIASIMGRYFAMDRDRRWDRTKKAYLCLTQGQGQRASSWQEVIEDSYQRGKTDEFIEPTNIIDQAKPIALIKAGDTAIFYNFRIDRPRQLTKAFVLDDFEGEANRVSYDPYLTKYYKRHLVEEEVLQPPFRRGKKIDNLYFITLTEYEPGLQAKVAFVKEAVALPLGRVLSDKGFFQLRLAESEKERFVTYYFNGQRETKFPLEERLIVPSPKVATYDLKPEMAALEITDSLIKSLQQLKYRFILVNYANPDMVGHTGDIEAAIKAVKTIDICLGKIVPVALELDYTVLITADHGNIEELIDLKSGTPLTEHNSNPVPFIAIDNQYMGRPVKLQTGILADVAPTVLSILELERPSEMTGRNLLAEL